MMVNKGVYCIIFSLFLISCGSADVKRPERPSNVPVDAEWYGGADGGVWCLVGESSVENQFMLEVYNDYEGSVWAKGEFMLNPDCSIERTFTVDEIKKSIDAWTGETVSLNVIGENGRTCSLIPVE